MSEAQRIPVLMYHRVGSARNDWEARYAISPSSFAAQMDALERSGHFAVDVDRFVDWLDGGPALPEGSFVITFDDGFRGVREHAMPELESRGWPFTVFLVSDLIGKEDAWTKASNPAGVCHPLLDADEIKAMQAQGVRFHSHTRSHPSLPSLDDAALDDQLIGSRRRLSSLLGHDVRFIAYPFGHADARVQAATKAAGYVAGFSTRSGFNRRDVDRFQIRRIDVFGTDTPSMLLRKMRLGTNDGRLMHAARYYAGRLVRRFTAGAAR